MNIPLALPAIGERESERVTGALRSRRLSLGPMLAEFEEKFADYVGARYAVAVNSGTSALHLAVKALGIGHGDEVLTTSFSFVASTNCLIYVGATPVFVDIDPATLNIDPGRVREILTRDYDWNAANRRAINRRTGRALKAILPVHIFGLPCEMDPISEIAKEFNLHILEDACEAIGAEYHGRLVGTFGDAAAFAFYPNKQMTTAEGGMIVTHNPDIARLCRSLRNQGRDENSEWLVHSHLGYNYRLSELHAALGLAQMERLDTLLTKREHVAALYSDNLLGIPEVVLPSSPPGMRRSWFVYPIRIRRAFSLRDHLMLRLRERGISCQAYFPAIHRQPYIREYTAGPHPSLPRTMSASHQCLALPFFPEMTDEQVLYVCVAVREILAQVRITAKPPEARAEESMEEFSHEIRH